MYHSDSSRWVMYVNDLGPHNEVRKSVPPLHSYEQHHHLRPFLLMTDAVMGRWGGGRPLLVNGEMVTGRRPDGKGSRQHTGVVWIHVLHAHDVCTYSALIHGVVEGRLFRHVVVRRRGWRHSDGLPLESEQRAEKTGRGGRRVTAHLTRDETNKVFCYLLTLQSRHKSQGQPPRWLRWG